MSIAITLLGHAPKKTGGYSSGGGEGGEMRFLHHAWCNSEEGEDFTKTNTDNEGHIQPFKYLGLCLSNDRDDEALSFNSYTWTYLCPCGSGGNGGNGGGTTPDPGGNGGSGGGQEQGGDPTPNNVVISSDCDTMMMTEGDMVYFLGSRSYGYDLSSREWTIFFDCFSMGISIWWDLDLCEGPIFFADIGDYSLSLDSRFINSKLTNMDNNSSGAWRLESPTPKMTIDNSEIELYATSGSHAIYGNDCQAVFEDITSVFFPPKQTYHITAVRDWESGGNGYFPEFNLYDITWEYRWKANSYEELIAMLPTKATVSYKGMSVDYEISHGDNPRNGNSLYFPNAYGPNGRKQMCKVYGDRNNTTADFAGTYVGSYMIDSRDNSKNLTTVRFRFFNNYSESDLPACVNGGSQEPEEPDYNTCEGGACDRSTFQDRYGYVWQHAYNTDLNRWVYYTTLRQGNDFVNTTFQMAAHDYNITVTQQTQDPITGDTQTLSLVRISDGSYVSGKYYYQGTYYWVGLKTTHKSSNGGNDDFKEYIWLD